MGLPSCQEVAQQLSAERDAHAVPRRPRRVRLHLLLCAACRRYERQLTWLGDNLRRAARAASASGMPKARRERVRAALRDSRRR